MSASLRPHGLQQARPPCPLPTLWVYSNSCPSRQWRHLTISSSVVPFSPCIRVFSRKSVLCIRWYQSFSFSNSPPNEYSRLNSFRIDWFDLAVQETINSLLQHHSSKASILRRSAFFTVQLSSPFLFALVNFTLYYSPGSQLALRLCSPPGTKSGLEKVLPPCGHFV